MCIPCSVHVAQGIPHATCQFERMHSSSPHVIKIGPLTILDIEFARVGSMHSIVWKCCASGTCLNI